MIPKWILVHRYGHSSQPFQQKVRLEGPVGKELFDPWRGLLPVGGVLVRSGGHLAVCAILPLLSSHNDSQVLSHPHPSKWHESVWIIFGSFCLHAVQAQTKLI